MGGFYRSPRATVGSAGALGACNVASIARRHANTAPFAHMKKNACNRRLNGRLSDRNCDQSGLKSSFIPPVRSLEAWGAQRSELRTPQNPSVSAYLRHSAVRTCRLRPTRLASRASSRPPRALRAWGCALAHPCAAERRLTLTGVNRFPGIHTSFPIPCPF